MAKKTNPTPEVNAKYGAPMGRVSRSTVTDKHGRTFELTVTEDAKPMNLIRCPLNSGGYDRGGAYWGIGEPLYYYSDHTGSITGYVRGRTRQKAKEAVISMFPKARFYR